MNQRQRLSYQPPSSNLRINSRRSTFRELLGKDKAQSAEKGIQTVSQNETTITNSGQNKYALKENVLIKSSKKYAKTGTSYFNSTEKQQNTLDNLRE